MSNEPIRRNRYVRNSQECLNEGSHFFNQDFDEFHLPKSRVQLSSLHDWGVAQGLEVEGAIGDARVTVHPGVAIDAPGNLISLASQGRGTTGETSPIAANVPIEISLEDLQQTTGETAYYLTIEFYELYRREPFHPCDRVLEQAPWVRLQRVEGEMPFVDDGKTVVLAQVTVSPDGTLSQLSTRGRRWVGKTVETLSIVRSASADDHVAQVTSGHIGPDAAGGLQITVPQASDRITLEQVDGNPFAEFEVQANATTFGGSVALADAVQVTGPLTAQNTLDVTGDATFLGGVRIEGTLEVQGDVIARDAEHIAGDVVLGDADTDKVEIAGVLSSKHSSGSLVIGDTVTVEEAIQVNGEVVAASVRVSVDDEVTAKEVIQVNRISAAGEVTAASISANGEVTATSIRTEGELTATSVQIGTDAEAMAATISAEGKLTATSVQIGTDAEAMAATISAEGELTATSIRTEGELTATSVQIGTDAEAMAATISAEGELTATSVQIGTDAEAMAATISAEGAVTAASVRANTVEADRLVGDGAVSRGMIMMWSGTKDTIPHGWVLCNGENDTPNLSDRFIVAAGDVHEAEQKGEPDTHTHAVDPPSTNLSIRSAGSHHHHLPDAWRIRKKGGSEVHNTIDPWVGTREELQRQKTQSSGSHSHSGTVNIGRFNSGASSSLNRPRWFALCFIMKT